MLLYLLLPTGLSSRFGIFGFSFLKWFFILSYYVPFLPLPTIPSPPGPVVPRGGNPPPNIPDDDDDNEAATPNSSSDTRSASGKYSYISKYKGILSTILLFPFSACQSLVTSDSGHGSIHSSHKTKYWDSRISCDWVVVGKPSTTIQLSFLDNQASYSVQCFYFNAIYFTMVCNICSCSALMKE